jgi:hypothetical protein
VLIGNIFRGCFHDNPFVVVILTIFTVFINLTMIQYTISATTMSSLPVHRHRWPRFRGAPIERESPQRQRCGGADDAPVAGEAGEGGCARVEREVLDFF